MKTVLLAVLAVILAFFTARGVWTVEALQTAGNVTNLLNTGGDAKTEEEALATFDGYMRTTRYLADTCVLVAKCTPSQAINARHLVDKEFQRAEWSGKFVNIRRQVIARFKVGDTVGAYALKPTFEDYKAHIIALTSEIAQSFRAKPLPEDLKPIFEATI